MILTTLFVLLAADAPNPKTKIKPETACDIKSYTHVVKPDVDIRERTALGYGDLQIRFTGVQRAMDSRRATIIVDLKTTISSQQNVSLEVNAPLELRICNQKVSLAYVMEKKETYTLEALKVSAP